MTFKDFALILQDHIRTMCIGTSHLFEVNLDKQKLWDQYLANFKPADNPVYIKRTEHDCSECRHFIKALGNVVAIINGRVVTIWDVAGVDKFQPSVNAMAAFVKAHPISDVFVTDTRTFGTRTSHAQAGEEIITWHHFFAELPDRMKIYARADLGAKRGELRDTRNVLQRSLDEISVEATATVLDLIGQGSLYKGEEWNAVLQSFLALQREYAVSGAKDLFCWTKSLEVGPVIGRIRNHSIGTLLVDLSEGKDLDVSVKSYEKIVAPTNYKRPKVIFTKRMVENAERAVEELGLRDSLPRRYAVMDDITINNVLFANRDARQRMSGSAFESLMGEVQSSPKRFERLDEVPIVDFVQDVLPTATSVELYLENRHAGNMVSLIAPQHRESFTLFKWANGFSWAYAGNITDSMKERVKSMGGKVDGVLRFSICWNEDGDNNNDFDAHCIEPTGNHIFYPCKMPKIHSSTGRLDVDIIYPSGNVAVENITWTQRDKMPRGIYKFYVNNFSHRGGRSGFKAEVEFDGQIYAFEYPRELRRWEDVDVAEVTLLPSGEFKLKELIPSSLSGREVWGLKTNEFHPVTIAMHSPNYWDAQDGIGHRHTFFMLSGCRNPEQPNGFFNEFLREEFMKHKRVFEALGAKMRVEPSEDQLSGVGFSATKHDSFVCKVSGRFNRTIKVVI